MYRSEFKCDVLNVPIKIFKLDFDDYLEDKNDENKQYDCFIE